MRKGRAILRDKREQRVRAKAMLTMRVAQSAPIDKIAEQFNVCPNTVRKALSFARRAELLVEEEDRLLETLVPKAGVAILKALDSDDIEVASRVGLEIYKGAGVLKKRSALPGKTDDDELAKYVERMRNEISVTIIESPAPKALTSGICEGEELPRNEEGE